MKLAISHHTIHSFDKIESDKPLVFVMDPPKPEPAEGEKPKGKKRKSAGNSRTLQAKSFGSVLNIAKIKKANRLVIGWRMRCFKKSWKSLIFSWQIDIV